MITCQTLIKEIYIIYVKITVNKKILLNSWANAYKYIVNNDINE